MALAHRIESRPIENRFARGWHCLGLAADYRDGRPHTLDAFGTRLAAYQGGDGAIHVLDGYCPHMGGDLSHGTVAGDSVICPFHHWSWGPDGRCNRIPYAERIPSQARVKAWPTCEQNRLLFVWNDREGNPPRPELAIPPLGACASDEWSEWVIEKWTINTNCRELLDNVADMAHFAAVHGAPADYFANLFEGHKATQVMVGRSTNLAGEGRLMTRATYFGPAYQITEMSGQMGGFTIASILLNSHVPITPTSFDLRFGMLVRKIPGLSEEQHRGLVDNYIKLTQMGFYQDVAIWDNKIRIDNPLLCDRDGPIYHLRRWYQQFYLDAAKVPEEMVKARAFELNMGLTQPPPPLHHVFEDSAR